MVHLPLTTKVLPTCSDTAELWSLTRSKIEYSLVLSENLAAPLTGPDAQVNGGWVAYYLQGPIPFNMTGIIARLTSPLGEIKVGCFVVSTFDSDFVLVKKADQLAAQAAWQQGGITILGSL